MSALPTYAASLASVVSTAKGQSGATAQTGRDADHLLTLLARHHEQQSLQDKALKQANASAAEQDSKNAFAHDFLAQLDYLKDTRDIAKITAGMARARDCSEVAYVACTHLGSLARQGWEMRARISRSSFLRILMIYMDGR